MVNRVIYAEASSLFLTAYLPNMGVHLNSLQELSDCIDVFGDRCPGLLVSLTQFHTSLAPDTKPFRDAVMSKLLCMGLDEPSLENGQAGMRWVDCSTSSERAKDEAIVYTMFTSDLYLAPSVFRVYPALFIRGNVGRAPWLRQILEDPMLRRDMGMTRIPGTKLWLQVRPY